MKTRQLTKYGWDATRNRLTFAAGIPAGEHRASVDLTTDDGKTASADFTLTVSTSPIASIAVTTPPTRTSYQVGDVFDPAGMVVTATDGDGGTAVLSAGQIVVTAPALTTPGTATVTVALASDPAITTHLTVSVSAKSSAPSPLPPSSVSASLSARLTALVQRYGAAHVAKLKLKVAPRLAGKAKVFDGHHKLGKVNVKNGKATFRFSRHLARGKHKITVVFKPSSPTYGSVTTKAGTLKVRG